MSADLEDVSVEPTSLDSEAPENSLPAEIDMLDVSPVAEETQPTEVWETHSPPEKPHRYYPYSSAEFGRLPSQAWLVEGVVPAQGVIACYGGPGTGKSVLMTDMIRCVSDGLPWFGREVSQQPVWYLALEGGAGMRMRVLAAEAHYGARLKAKFLFDDFSFLKEEDVKELLALVDAYDGVGLIVIDTLACAMPGGDENGSRDLGMVVAGAKALQKKTGGAVVLIHHTGKDPKRGMRGHSVLPGAIDTAIEVTRHEDHREWRVTKQRDAEDGIRGGFELVRVELPYDDQGRTVHSVAISEVELPDSDDDGSVKGPMGKNQRLALDLLTGHLAELQEGGEERPSIATDAAIKLVMAQIEAGPKHKKLRAKEAVEGLINMNFMVVQGDRLMRLEDADAAEED
ncbi:MAG TPA: AAA family ATPase [Variovorax sp.]|nr:AAA family ATPase [Variovorax sp.]